MTYPNPWIYKGNIFDTDDIGEYIGFVYLITDPNGKLYIGKKIFWNKVAKPPLKGKTRRRISKKYSDWQQYYGSSPDLKKQIETDNELLYKREILYLCFSKSHMGYMETKELFARDVLLNDNYWNHWISARIQRNQLRGSYFSATG